MFVTINAKHTRLNASHSVSLSGRQLYRDENLAAAHDVVRALNDREDSPLYGEIKLLGVGTGRVAQAPLAQELKKLFATEAFGAGKKGEAFREEAKKFYVNYLKQVAQVFGAAWNGRKYSIKSATALRAFVRVAPDIVRGLDQEHVDRTDFRAIGRDDRAVGPPHRRSAVRDRRGLEARRDDRGFADEGTAARAAVSGRELQFRFGNLEIWEFGNLRQLELVPSPDFQISRFPNREPRAPKKRGADIFGAPDDCRRPGSPATHGSLP
jgi:hypothetical protein